MGFVSQLNIILQNVTIINAKDTFLEKKYLFKYFPQLFHTKTDLERISQLTNPERNIIRYAFIPCGV